MKKLLLIFVLTSAVYSQNTFQPKPITLAELAIEVTGGHSREIAFTNKEAGVFYTETNGEHRTGWQGWRVMSVEMMEDYMIRIDGRELKRQDALRTLAYPHQLVREYGDGVIETVTFLDSIDALIVEVKCGSAKIVEVRPMFSDAQTIEEYKKDFQQKVLLLAKQKHLSRTSAENYPVWLGCTIATRNGILSQRSASLTVNRKFSPSSLATTVRHGSVTAIFVLGDTKEQTIRLANTLARKYARHILGRKQRMENLLNQSYLRTDNTRFTKALQWAKISMDALIMNQLKKGIFAGLPWFDNYWGRDTFIALAGATLVMGNFSDAKNILRSFAEWQDADLKSSTYGRIPNLVTTLSKSYNTADGTPRFVVALDDYLKYSGDTSIISEMYPVVKRSIEGALQYHTDSLMFLTHADAETWMDAVGPNGPWSPRGNRANDIQALWSKQLDVGSRWAAVMGDLPSAEEWNTIHAAVKKNFSIYFIDTARQMVFDHLNIDGSADIQLRPNQLEAYELLSGNLNAGTTAVSLFKQVTEKLVYPHGVASLSQDDVNFHPYHHYSPFYVQDAAYHNGIVWTWLSGKWIDIAVANDLPDLAFTVTEYMANQILERGAIGTLSELIDAAPRPGEQLPHLSGTFSQAWSLAEFIRNVYQSYLGISIDATRKIVTIHPRLPIPVRFADFKIPYTSGSVYGRIASFPNGDSLFVGSNGHYDDLSLKVSLQSGGTSTLKSQISISPFSSARLVPSGGQLLLHEVNQSRTIPAVKIERSIPSALRAIRLAKPVVQPGLRSMKGPDHRMLTNSEVKQTNPSAKLLYDREDPIDDDKGTGGYLYPQTLSLKRGSLDITRCAISADEKNVYFSMTFRSLSDPGWHPEYGFQLTYIAIAIDKDQTPGSGNIDAGMNSNFMLADSMAYEHIIYVGGGIRVEDSKGTILAEYLPVAGDEHNPLGDVQSKTVIFSLSHDVIGTPNTPWRCTILVGAQDDHGGAGIGEFRSVAKEPKEWAGGGKERVEDPNIYDVIILQ